MCVLPESFLTQKFLKKRSIAARRSDTGSLPRQEHITNLRANSSLDARPRFFPAQITSVAENDAMECGRGKRGGVCIFGVFGELIFFSLLLLCFYLISTNSRRICMHIRGASLFHLRPYTEGSLRSSCPLFPRRRLGRVAWSGFADLFSNATPNMGKDLRCRRLRSSWRTRISCL